MDRHSQQGPSSAAVGSVPQLAPRQNAYESYQTRLTLEKRDAGHRVSCDCCRLRKIKCTGEKPVCSNCERRKKPCTYPSQVRRRGPDKKPGKRRRGKGTPSRLKDEEATNDPPSTEKEVSPEESDAVAKSSTSGRGQNEVLDAWTAPSADVNPLWAGIDLGISLPPDAPGVTTAAYYEPPPIGNGTLDGLNIPLTVGQLDSVSHALPHGSTSNPPDSTANVWETIPLQAAGYGLPSPNSPTHLFPRSQSRDAQSIPLNISQNHSFQSSNTAQADYPPACCAPIPPADVSGSLVYPNTMFVDDSMPQVTGEMARHVYGVASTSSGGGVYAGQQAVAVSGQHTGSVSASSTVESVWHSPESLPGEIIRSANQLGTDNGEALWLYGVMGWPLAHDSTEPFGEYAQAQQQELERKSQERKARERSSMVVALLEMSTPPGNIQVARDGWWSWILDWYDPDRAVATQRVTKICSTFFSDTHIWLNFLNRDLFFHSLFSQSSVSTTTRSPPSLRAAPHILLAILALTTLLQAGHTTEGQERALVFASEAQSLLAYCIHAGSQDPSLVAAALILTVFEFQPHARHSDSRVGGAMFLLEGIGSTVFSKRLDADDARVSTSVTGFPRVRGRRGREAQKVMAAAPVEAHLAQWAQVPSWNAQWTEGEMWKEEMRRMCWAACNLGATYSLWCVLRGERCLPMDVGHPEKFRLLFPGEAVFIDHGDSEQGKTTPWAIYQRLICLWHYVHNNHSLTSTQKEEVIREIEIVEEDLSLRVAEEGPKIYYWFSMDWVMIIRRVLGVFDKQLLVKWIQSQQSFTRTLESGIPGFPRIIHRPMHCWWYVVEAFFAIDLSIPYPDLWSDADQMYTFAQNSLDEIAAHWGSQASLRPFKTSLNRRYLETLVERERALRGAVALEEEKALKRAVGYMGEMEWSEVNFKCMIRGG